MELQLLTLLVVSDLVDHHLSIVSEWNVVVLLRFRYELFVYKVFIKLKGAEGRCQTWVVLLAQGP